MGEREGGKEGWKDEPSQKSYIISGSLCLTSFINIDTQVILVVIGQRPSGGH